MKILKTYANVRFDLKADHSAKFDLSTNNIFKFKIYIPSADLTGNQDNKVELKLRMDRKTDLGKVSTAFQPC